MPAVRRTLSTTGAIALTLTLVLGGSPARAGQLNVPDPAGDATAVGDRIPQQESTPRPSDPELDILNVHYSSTPTELRIDLKMAKIGHPTASVGYTYRVQFTHGAKEYEFLYQVFNVPGIDQPLFILRESATGTRINCKCSGKVNGKTATLEIRAEIASLSKAIKAHDSSAPPIGPGTKFTNLQNYADRITGFLLVAADWAIPPAPASFTF